MDKTMKTETVNSKNTTEKLFKVKGKLAIEYRSIATLSLDPRNPRLHNEKQIRQIAKSIEVFGFNVPILINGEMQVVAGHGRLQACKLLGLTEAPTILLEHLTEAQTRAFVIADNRLTENSVWDERLLGEQFKQLSVLDLDFSIDVTGFEMSEIEVMIEGLTPASSGKDDPGDAIPDSSARPQVTRTGDLWNLNCHRVYCGDARKNAAYSALMEGQRATTVFSAPPYNDPVDGYVAGFEGNHYPEFAPEERNGTKFTTFLAEVLALLARHSADGALQFICMDWRYTAELLTAARQAYTEFKNLCVWVKGVAGGGAPYRSQHELVFVFKSGKGKHHNSNEPGQFGRSRTDVWQYKLVNSTARSADKSSQSGLHLTIRPVELIADAILDCTARGDVVLDAFLGRGSTVIAAERTGRVCYGIELDPRNVDTIVRRWQFFTGHIAIQESTGRKFNEIEEENYGRAK